MAATDELLDFVKQGLSRGMTREAIRDALLRAGWAKTQVEEGLLAYADVDCAVPVPRPRPYVSAREVFTHLLMFATLYVSAYTLGSLLFELIDVRFPDPATPQYWEHTTRAIRWSISLLLVSFPLTLFIAAHVARGMRRDPSKRSSRIRRQLTYVTLFIASCVLLGDAATLIYNVLGGELTTRFVLKVLVLAAIAGSAFAYWLWDIRTVDAGRAPEPWNRYAVGAAALAVTATVVAGLWVIESPSEARDSRFDQTRVSALREISRAIDVYYSRNQRVPETLFYLGDVSSADPRDPSDGQVYEYTVRGEREYELCATFSRQSTEPRADFWWHGAGRQCYPLKVRDIRPAR
jgi:hypothetical protein